MMKKRRNFKTNKVLLSVSTAFLVISSVVPTAGNADQVNAFSVISDKSYVSAEDGFNVTIDFIPDEVGASGFTFDLYYDSNKVRPLNGDKCGLDNDGSFLIMSNSVPDEGRVRIVGAYMNGDNITDECTVASVDFEVIDGASGEADYWIDVDSLVYFDGEDYAESDYSVPTKYAPYTVTLLESQPIVPQVTVITEEEVPVEVTEKAAEEKQEDNTAVVEQPSEDTETFTETAVQEEPVVIELVPEKKAEEEVKLPEADGPVYEPNDNNTDSKLAEEKSDEPLFEYSMNEDYSGEDIQYGFNISDNISDYNNSYDIAVKLDSTGFVNGCIGMMDNCGQWVSQEFETYSGADEWVFTGLDPNSCWDQVFVQVYYLQDGADLSIDSVSFRSNAINSAVSADEADPASADSDAESSAETVEPSEKLADRGYEMLGYTPTVAVVQENTEDNSQAYPSSESDGTSSPKSSFDTSSKPEDSSNSEASSKEQDSSSAIESTSSSSVSDESSAAEVKKDDSAVQSDSSKADTSSEAEKKSADDSKNEAVQKEVARQTKSAEKNANTPKANNSNPNTGSGVKGISFLTFLKCASALYILYSLFAVIYKKTEIFRKNSE